MFKFLKEKLKSAVSVFAKKVEEEVEEKPKEKKVKEKKPFLLDKSKREVSEPQVLIGKRKLQLPKEKKKVKEEPEVKEEPKKSFLGKIFKKEEKPSILGKVKKAVTTKKLSEEKFDSLFWNLEMILLENNVAVSVIEKIKEDLKKDMVDTRIGRFDIQKTIEKSLKKSLNEILKQERIDFLKQIKQKRPFVICFFGVNGSGKTTTIAKIAKLLQKNKLNSVMAASDTFRAAAIQQLEKHGNNLKVKVIKHSYGSDAAAVAFDAVEYAKAHRIDAVLIDTAGRSHSNVNLMDELKKIVRVAKPDLNIFVGDSLTGNDMVEQAEKYNEIIGIDAIILAKADVDEKGGATISASYVTKKPILFIGTGQGYGDIKDFNSDEIMKGLGLV